MRQVKLLNVPVTPELCDLVAAHVGSGRLGSASEVIRAALRVFDCEPAATTSVSSWAIAP